MWNTEQRIIHGPADKRSISVREALKTEPSGPEDWDSFDGDYNDAFSNLIGESTSIQDFATSIYEEHGQLLSLDLMGYGQALSGLPGAGVANAMSEVIYSAIPDEKNHMTKKPDLVIGNIMRHSTWNQLSDWLTRQDVTDKRFNLVLCKPSGGFIELSAFPLVHLTLLQRLWNLTSSNNGVILTQIPASYDDNEIESLRELLSQKKITTSFSETAKSGMPLSHRVMSITKSPESSEQITP